MVTLTLTQLPPELVTNVLSFVDPEDLPMVNLTCRYLYHTVRDNTALFRALYLNNLVSLDALRLEVGGQALSSLLSHETATANSILNHQRTIPSRQTSTGSGRYRISSS